MDRKTLPRHFGFSERYKSIKAGTLRNILRNHNRQEFAGLQRNDGGTGGGGEMKKSEKLNEQINKLIKMEEKYSSEGKKIYLLRRRINILLDKYVDMKKRGY
jgi:hypothetical protein